jgi:hypothetical protein
MKHKNSLLTFLFATFTLASGLALGSGTLQVNGEPGRMQLFRKVKAVRCDTTARGSCDEPVYLDLKKPLAVPAGSYLVGFENSIYPGWVNVQEGGSTVLELERIQVPSSVKGSGIRIFRDFTSLVEQKKIYLTMFAMNRHFFKLDKNNFTDLYLAGSWDRDFVQRFTYEICPRVASYAKQDPAGQALCAVWNKARGMMDLRTFYNFADNGTFTEMWVTYPGDVSPTVHPRYLVSVPMSEGDFVSVFPGSYRVQAAKKGSLSVQVKVGESTSNRFSLSDGQNLISVDPNAASCFGADLWKTEYRAYCKSDNQEGCDRNSARICEGM